MCLLEFSAVFRDMHHITTVHLKLQNAKSLNLLERRIFAIIILI
jgi:hypothetical protein